MKQLMPMTPASPAKLRQIRLVGRLCHVTADFSAHKYWLSSIDDAEVITSLERIKTALRAEARVLECEASLLIDDDPLWTTLTREFTAVESVAGACGKRGRFNSISLRPVGRKFPDQRELATPWNESHSSRGESALRA
jgi:hypothetical protein